MLKDFKAFVMRGNVVDLAVGVVIGAAFNAVVQSLVTGMLNPIVSLFGAEALGDLKVTFGEKVVDGRTVPETVFAYGAVLNALLQFLIVAAFLFFVVVRPINTLESRRRGGEETPVPTTRSCPECLSEIPKAARRCRRCTSEIGAVA